MANVKLNSHRHDTKSEKIKRQNTLKYELSRGKSGLKPNSNLSHFGKLLFKSIVQNNDQLSTADNPLVNLLCTEYETYFKAVNFLNDHGLVQDGKKSPYYSIMKQSIDEIIKLSSKLGLTTEDRINNDFQKQDTKDPIKQAIEDGEHE